MRYIDYDTINQPNVRKTTAFKSFKFFENSNKYFSLNMPTINLGKVIINKIKRNFTGP